jgi:hypothetical protein
MNNRFDSQNQKKDPKPPVSNDISITGEELEAMLRERKTEHHPVPSQIESIKSNLTREELALYMNEYASSLYLASCSQSAIFGRTTLEWIGEVENLALNIIWKKPIAPNTPLELFPLAHKLINEGEFLTASNFGNNLAENIKLIARISDCFMNVVPDLIDAGQVSMRYNGNTFEVTLYNINLGAHEIIAEVPVTATNYDNPFARERATAAAKQLVGEASNASNLNNGSRGLFVDSASELAMKVTKPENQDF